MRGRERCGGMEDEGTVWLLSKSDLLSPYKQSVKALLDFRFEEETSRDRELRMFRREMKGPSIHDSSSHIQLLRKSTGFLGRGST